MRTSVGSIAVWNVSMKKSRAANGPVARLRCGQTIVALVASRTAGQSDDGSAWAHGAADRAPVADLRVADPAGGVVRAAGSAATTGVLVDLAMRGPAADPQVVARLDDRVEAGRRSRRSTSRAGLREAELEQRQEAVAAGQELGLTLPIDQDPQGLVRIAAGRT